MPAKQFGRLNLDLLYPPFRDRWFDLIANCNARGAIYFATYGIRTYEESDHLYAQGRTLPGKIVTNAKAGQSAHNFGIAGDNTHDEDGDATNGLQPDWQAEHYAILAEEAPKVGLVSGASFGLKDWPHVQLPGFVTGSELAPLDRIFRATPGDLATKLKAVWDYLDTLNAQVCA